MVYMFARASMFDGVVRFSEAEAGGGRRQGLGALDPGGRRDSQG